jgi:hypothetical protein
MMPRSWVALVQSGAANLVRMTSVHPTNFPRQLAGLPRRQRQDVAGSSLGDCVARAIRLLDRHGDQGVRRRRGADRLWPVRRRALAVA